MNGCLLRTAFYTVYKPSINCLCHMDVMEKLVIIIHNDDLRRIMEDLHDQHK